MAYNCTDILTCNYNLTLLTGTDIVNEPVNWLANVNQLLNSYMVISGMILLGVVLFVSMRNSGERSDSESLVYSGLVISVIGILLFAAGSFGLLDEKLLTWNQLLPFLVVTMAGILWNKWNG